MSKCLSGQPTPRIVPGALSALRAIAIIAWLAWARPALADGIIWNPGPPGSPVWCSLICFLLWFVPTLAIKGLVIGLPSARFLDSPAMLWLIGVGASAVSAMVFSAIYPCLCRWPSDPYSNYVLPALALGLVEGLVVGRLLDDDRLGLTRTPPLLLCVVVAIAANLLAVMAGTMLQKYLYVLATSRIE